MLITRLCSEFKKAKVSYAIVGGYAVALHGAVRGTMDVDFVIEQKLAAYQKVEKVLLGMGLESRLPVVAEEVFNFREEYIKNRNLIAWSFYNPKSPSEVVDIIITHDLGKMKKKKKKFRDVEIHVLALEDLIAMKSGTGRAQDREDVKALESLK